MRAPESMTRQRRAVSLRRKLFCLIGILLTISSPLHGSACCPIKCDSRDCHSMADCQGMEMPKQVGAVPVDPGSPCCLLEQIPVITFQQSPTMQRFDIATNQSVPGDLLDNPATIRTTIPHLVKGSPPDRQSLLCTLVI